MQCYRCAKELQDGARECRACGQSVYSTMGSANASGGRRLDGCLPDIPSPKDFVAVPNISSLPPRVDLRPGCSPVENQGSVGSCTANAIVGAVEFKRWKTGRQDDLSRLFVYFNARRIAGMAHEDCGARIAHGMAALLAHGAPPESAWPYDPSKVNVEPDADAYAKATANIEVEYARLNGLEHIKGGLARDQPVVFASSLPMRCYDEAARTGLVPAPTQAELAAMLSEHGRHSMLLVGYDDDARIFHVRNSWGREWGDQGYCRMPFDVFESTMAVNTAWILGALESTGAFSVTRPAAPAAAPTVVEGSVRGTSARLRDDIRGGLKSDIDSALKSVRDRVNPPRREG